MNAKMIIKYKSKNIEIPHLKKLSEFGKFFGLMFVRREKARALLFEFKKPTKLTIHSCFVFFPFAAIWLDKRNKIIFSSTIKPFRAGISPGKPFCKLIEIPFNTRYSKILQSIVGWKDLNI